MSGTCLGETGRQARGASRLVDIDPILAIVGVEVLAAILGEAAAARVHRGLVGRGSRGLGVDGSGLGVVGDAHLCGWGRET